jgi:tetratricopeptide (TPR) repeat protein
MRKMGRERFLPGKAVLLIICLIVLAAKAFAIDQFKIKEYEEILLADAGCADLETLLTESEKLAGTLSLENLTAEEFLPAVRLGILYHNLSLLGAGEGRRGYAGKAVTVLTRVYHHPGLPEELRPISGAYLGSGLALAGGEAINPAKKIKYVRDGLKYLDTAVKKYGRDSYFPLFLRANVGIALPSFFRREKTAVQDYLALAGWYNREPERIPAGIMASVFLHLGEYYKKEKKLDEAVAYWRKARQLDPEGEAGARAKELLELFEG